MNHHPHVGTVGHIDHSLRRYEVESVVFADAMDRLASAPVPFKPTHWPPRLTRMALAVRLGTTRMLLERRP